VLWPLEDGAEVLGCYQDFVAQAPNEVATILTLRPLREVGRPLLDLVDLRPYVALQALADATVPHGWHYYWKSADLPTLDDTAINTLLEHGSQIRSPWSYAVLFHLGGAIADVDQDATAYAHRHAAHNLNINAVWLPNQSGEHEIAWAQGFFAAIQPHQVGAYINFLDRDDADRVPAAYGDATYRRLVALKDRLDPDNLFRLNHNVPPSTIGTGAGVPRAAGTPG
jgi:hypothetical protein